MDLSILQFEEPRGSFPKLFSLLEEYANRAKEIYKQKLDNDDARATGNLINSIDTFVTYGDLTFNIYMTLEDYWKYIEYGRPAGKRFPPIDKIREWVTVKPIIPYPDSKGKLPTPDQLAFLIARKIAKEGIPAGEQLATTLAELNEQYLPRLQQALQEDWVDTHSIQIHSMVTKTLRDAMFK